MRFFLCLIGLVLSFNLQATHNRAGEITYRHLNGLTYEATITTYTKADSPADRPQLTIDWGDGISEEIPRINGGGFGVLVSVNIKKNIYKGIHTFPAPGIYTISFEDPNRNEGIVNIPNSINIPFYVSSQLIINPFYGVNNSVELLNPPLDMACAGQIFTHNPAAFDADGDSLSYRFVECKGEDGLSIPGFQLPQATASISIDPFNGTLTWNTPPINGAGEYNIAFVVEEWRNGILVGSVIRDMQITVVPCSNVPPVVAFPPDICVTAGDQVQFSVQASDISNQTLTLSAFGGPFLFAPPGQAIFPTITQVGSVSQTFNWITNCEHIRLQPYQVTFKVIDDGAPINLTSYSTSTVRVVSPATEWVSALPQGNGINLTWLKKPCQNSLGYKLYRRLGFAGFVPSLCETGVPTGIGYELIRTFNSQNDTIFYDTDNGNGLIPGIDYCYIVVVTYPDGSESYASTELCAQLKRDMPIITQVSVEETSTGTGKVKLSWSKPTEFDTLQAPGPYVYHIYRSNQFNGNYTLVDSTLSINDTTYTDVQNLNTESVWYAYRIDFLNTSLFNRFIIGQSRRATSVFLAAQPADNQIQLNWNFNVPWSNTAYTIFRKQGSIFQPIGTTNQQFYTDSGLANDTLYCYKVESSGQYNTSGLMNPILNLSQEICVAASDNTSPCILPFDAKANCDLLRNELSWNFILSDSCLADCYLFEVTFTNTHTQQLQSVLSFTCFDSLQAFLHFPGNSLAGCYQLIATDSSGNKSQSALLCVDNCPTYELPTIFTPNGDGMNDLFRPFPYRFIESVDVQIFNRWGQTVFKTTDPEINWNGKTFNTGSLCTDGVYYLAGEVNEITLQGIRKRTLKQSIQLISN